MDAGVTQKEIGFEVGLSQATVSDLANGRIKDIRWTTGQRLLALHAARCKEGEPPPPSRPRPLLNPGQGATQQSDGADSIDVAGEAGTAGVGDLEVMYAQ